MSTATTRRKSPKRPAAKRAKNQVNPVSPEEVECHLGSIQDAVWQLEDAIGKPGCVSKVPPDEDDENWDDPTEHEFEEMNSKMIAAARPLVEQLKEKPGSLPNDVWICKEGRHGDVTGFLVSRPGDPADIVAHVDMDDPVSDEQNKFGPEDPKSGVLHAYFCAAVLIAAYGDKAGEAAWSHVGNAKFGHADSHDPVPGELFGARLSRPFASDRTELGDKILFPLCRFRFARMLQRYVDEKMGQISDRGRHPTRRYVVGFVNEITEKNRLVVVTTGTGLDLSVGDTAGWRS